MCHCPQQSEEPPTKVRQRRFSDSSVQSLSAGKGSTPQKTISWRDAPTEKFATEAKQKSSFNETSENESFEEIGQPSTLIPRLASNIKCRIKYLCQCLGMFFNRLMKFSPKIIKFFAHPVLSLWSGDQQENKFNAINLYDFEVMRSQALLQENSSICLSWCQTVRRLMSLWFVLHYDDNKNNEKKINILSTAGILNHTIIIEGQNPISTYSYPVDHTTEIFRNCSWQTTEEQKKTLNMLQQQGEFKKYPTYEYIFFTEELLMAKTRIIDVIAAESQYQMLLETFKILHHQKSSFFKKTLIVNIQSSQIGFSIEDFCNELQLKLRHFYWDKMKNQQLWDNLTNHSPINLQQQQKSPSVFEKQGTSSIEAHQSSQKGVAQFNEAPQSIVSSRSLQITQTLQITQNIIPNQPNQIVPVQDAQNKQEQQLAQMLQKLEKTYAQSNLAFLKEVEQLIIKTEKELQLLICLKYFMTQCKYCKYRSKLGFQCNCQYDIRTIEIKKNYLQRLYKHRNRLQAYQRERRLKSSQATMANKGVENVVAEPSSNQFTSSQPLLEIQPHQRACNQLNAPAPEKEPTNDENQKKKLRFEREAIRHRSDWTSKKIPRGREKLKRDRCNYSEQELNLHNLLDQLHLNEGFRVSCNVEEDNINKWKEMAEKYKNKDIKTFQKQGKKRT